MYSVKLKKLVAREFLYLLGVFLTLVLIYSCFLLYNIWQETRVKKINSNITTLNTHYQNFLSKPLKTKYKNITQEKIDSIAKFITAHPQTTTDYLNNFIPGIESDSILLRGFADYAATSESQKYKFRKEQNLKFPEFFVFNQVDIDSSRYFQSKANFLLSEKVKYEENILSNSEIRNYIFMISLLLLILIFGFRYIFYATKWSIQTIKSNN